MKSLTLSTANARLANRLDYRDSPVSTPHLMVEVLDIRHPLPFLVLHGLWRFELRPLHLNGKYLTHWAFSLIFI